MNGKGLFLFFGSCLTFLAVFPCSAEFYFGGYTGKAFTLGQDIHIEQPSLDNNITCKDVSFDDKSFEPPIYYGIKLGYFFPSLSFLGIEAEFFHLKVFADTEKMTHVRGTWNGNPVNRTLRLDEVVERFDISHGVNFITLNVVGRLGYLNREDYPNGRLQPYAGLGLGGALLHVETDIDNRKREKYEWDWPAVQPFLGVRFYLTDHLILYSEYKYSYGDFKVKIPLGEGQVAVEAHHLILGAAVCF